MSILRRPKIGVVGGGQIGGIIALLAAQDGIDVGLVDIKGGLAQAKGLDIEQAGYAGSFGSAVEGGDSYENLEGSDIVIITSGLPRKPGQNRDDLLLINAEIIKAVTEQVMKHTKNPVLIYVANPVDAITRLGKEISGLDSNKVIGMAPFLDSSRFAKLLSEKLEVSMKDIVAPVLGGHGDTMVPLVRYTTVGGLPLLEWVRQGKISQDEVDDIVQETRVGGGSLVKLFGKDAPKGHGGSAFNAPAMCAYEMAKAIIKDENRVISVCTSFDGLYGGGDGHGVNIKRGTYVGLPVILGAGGVKRVIDYPLIHEEQTELEASVGAVLNEQNGLYEIESLGLKM